MNRTLLAFSHLEVPHAALDSSPAGISQVSLLPSGDEPYTINS